MTRQRFSQADIQRALKGAHAAGVSPSELRIGADGEIRLLLGKSAEPHRSESDVLDEIDRHFRHG